MYDDVVDAAGMGEGRGEGKETKGISRSGWTNEKRVGQHSRGSQNDAKVRVTRTFLDLDPAASPAEICFFRVSLYVVGSQMSRCSLLFAPSGPHSYST